MPRRGVTPLLVVLLLTAACAQASDEPPAAVATALDASPEPSPTPSEEPSPGDQPTAEPSATAAPSPAPTERPTAQPSEEPTAEPTAEPELRSATLHQASYDGAGAYTFQDIGQVQRLQVLDIPPEADTSRWAMLHDGGRYRLYFLNGDDGPLRLLQFVFDEGAYRPAGTPELPITGFPDDTSTSSFAMLHDGDRYRLYLRSAGGAPEVLQGAFNPASGAYEYGFASTGRIPVVNVPPGAVMDEWAMLHDGDAYRLYVHQAGRNGIHQFVYDGAAYDNAATGLPDIDVVSIPPDVDISDFAMLHALDGPPDYSLYHLER